MHLRSYNHPKDGEGSKDADKMEEENEILDEFQTDEQRLQEAKDHEFAIQLSQEEMSDDKDEYASFFIKPSTAFEGNCTASVSSVFDEQKQRKKSDVVPVEGNIITLMEMSFTHEQAFKALKMTDNNIEQAVAWIFAHPGDINQETPSGSQVDLHFSLTSDSEDEYDMICKKPSTAFEGNCTASVSRVFDEQKQPKKSDVVPVEDNIIMLMEMSFTREQAIKALKTTDNNIEQAVDWIFDHPGDMHHKLPMRLSQERSDGKNECDQ